MSDTAPPEYNVTHQDYADRAHFRTDVPPIIDFHWHVMQTRPPADKSRHKPDNKAVPSLDQAEEMLSVAAEFGIARVVTMCPPEDIAPLRERFGERLSFNGSITKKAIDSPDDEAYRLLDQFLAAGVKLLKFWSAPRGRERGLHVNAPSRAEAARRRERLASAP